MNNELAMAVLHPSWQVVQKTLRESREQYVKALVNTLDVNEGNILRGRIKELDTLLRLTDQAKRFKEGRA